MWDWSDQLKLGKSSAFVKRDLRHLPLTEADFDADFCLDVASSGGRCERWVGMALERTFGGVLAIEDVRFPPPTVNNLATLLAHAMLRPLNAQDRQRPRTIFLRNRPQWQELLPHLRQRGIEVVLSNDLPEFDEAAVEWMQPTKAKRLPSADKIKAALRQPFPERKPTWFTDAMDFMEWTDAMLKGAYASREAVVPSYDQMTVVPIHLAPEELEAILTKTTIAKTKKPRVRLEAMAAEGSIIELDISDWSRVVLALCGMGAEEAAACRYSLGIARRIANRLAEALEIGLSSMRT
jgi:hypothetical protein